MPENSKPKTISDEKLKYASKLVDQAIEPKVRKIVDELNKVLGKKGIRAGVELQWFFDEIG